MAYFAANTMNDLSAQVCSWYAARGATIECEIKGGEIDLTTPPAPYTKMPLLHLAGGGEKASIPVNATYDLVLMTAEQRKAAWAQGDLYHCSIQANDWVGSALAPG